MLREENSKVDNISRKTKNWSQASLRWRDAGGGTTQQGVYEGKHQDSIETRPSLGVHFVKRISRVRRDGNSKQDRSTSQPPLLQKTKKRKKEKKRGGGR